MNAPKRLPRRALGLGFFLFLIGFFALYTAYRPKIAAAGPFPCPSSPGARVVVDTETHQLALCEG